VSTNPPCSKGIVSKPTGHNRWFPEYREDAHTTIVPSRAFGDCARASSARRVTAGGRRIASFLATTDLVVDQKVRWKGRGFVDTLLGNNV